MFNRSAIVALLLLGLGAVASARAEGLAIKGVVKGTDGKPLAGAEVRAQRIDGKSSIVVATTNAKGEYNFTGLTLAPYKVTAVINKVPKSMTSIRTRANAWVRVDFDLASTAKVAKKKRMVWVSGETGSHIGGGHWESVDEPTTNSTTGTSSVERIDGAALRTQNVLNPAGGVSGPSH